MRRSTGQRRKRVLGCLLLWWQATVNLSNCVARLVCTDCFHMGRFRGHVHRSHAGHATPYKAQEAVPINPPRTIKTNRTKACLTIRTSPLLGFSKVCSQDANALTSACQQDSGRGHMALDEGSWRSWSLERLQPEKGQHTTP